MFNLPRRAVHVWYSLEDSASHINYFQTLKRRLMVFLLVCFHVHGTEEKSNYHRGHQITPGNDHDAYERVVTYVCLGSEKFKNSTTLRPESLRAG